jgi:hypothetical protein
VVPRDEKRTRPQQCGKLRSGSRQVFNEIGVLKDAWEPMLHVYFLVLDHLHLSLKVNAA